MVSVKSFQKKWIVFALVLTSIIAFIAAAQIVEKEPDTGGGSIHTAAISEGNDIAAPAGPAASGMKRIHAEADINLQGYAVDVKKVNIKVSAEELKIMSSGITITISLNRTMYLEDFTGKIVWKDSTLTLEGELEKYLTDYIKIDWKKSDAISVGLTSGFLEIDKVSIASLKSVASGKMNVGTKADLSLNRDELAITNYEGMFKSAVTQSNNQLLLNGDVEGISAKTADFETLIS